MRDGWRPVGFNGAMTFQPWIQWFQVNTRSTALSGFNGAMTFQPWIRAHRDGGGRGTLSFNGAMTFQPWIHVLNRLRETYDYRFQWGHDFSAMDTAFGRRYLPVAERSPSQYCLSILVSAVCAPPSPGRSGGFKRGYLRALVLGSVATGALAAVPKRRF